MGVLKQIDQSTSMWYLSEPDTLNKVDRTAGSGLLFCPATGKKYFDDEIRYRYCLRVQLTSDSNSVWCTFGDAAGVELFYCSAKDFSEMTVRERRDACASVINKRLQLKLQIESTNLQVSLLCTHFASI